MSCLALKLVPCLSTGPRSSLMAFEEDRNPEMCYVSAVCTCVFLQAATRITVCPAAYLFLFFFAPVITGKYYTHVVSSVGIGRAWKGGNA